jgi:hypothetical protein
MFIFIIPKYEQPVNFSDIQFLTIILLWVHSVTRKCLEMKNKYVNICHPVFQRADNTICPPHLSLNTGISPLYFMTFPFFGKDYKTDVSLYHPAL